ncbi:P-loop containing nucleoside triphosphate hydrolase protein [Amanita rubescens]|nr:P-loop containing nucleoside triphosphate hydrolase protein [Amanita rubescens]
MRLTSISQLPKDLVDALGKCGIRTDSDLLFSRTPLEVFHSLPNGTISLSDFLECFNVVTEVVSVPGMRAIDIFTQDAWVKTGVPIFDELVGESSRHEVIEISGARGSGKSATLNVVLHYLVEHPNASAIWFDTTGDFSAERITPILESLAAQDTASVLDQLQVCPCFDIDGVLSVLDSETDPNELHRFRLRCRFIVIDTVTQLLGSNLSAVSAQGHAMMVHFMRHLREKARHEQLTILVVNNAIKARPGLNNSVASGDRQPALGPSFAFLTDSTLWLSRCDLSGGDDDECTFKAEVLRSRKTPSRAWGKFRLRNGTVYEEARQSL